MSLKYRGAGILLALMSALNCQTDEFDLDYIPKDKAETSVVTQRMLATGEEIAYRKEHEALKLWIFRPSDVNEDELFDHANLRRDSTTMPSSGKYIPNHAQPLRFLRKRSGSSGVTPQIRSKRQSNSPIFESLVGLKTAVIASRSF